MLKTGGPEGGDNVPASGLTTAVKADGTAELTVNYTKAGEYTYTVSENCPDENPHNGITYDTHTENITVTVEDVDGSLVATVDPDQDLEFENSYATSGDAKIEFEKVFKGKNWTDEEFQFELYDNEGKKVGDTKTLTSEIRKGEFEIKNLTPNDDLSDKTYTYTLKEVAPGSSSGSDDNTNDASETTGNNAEAASGTDAEPAGGDVPAETPSSEETPSAGNASEETPSGNEGEEKGSEDNKLSGFVDSLFLTAYAADEPATVETENGTITYDPKTYEVTVTVHDNGNGTCTCSVEYPDEETVTFTNTYEPNPATVELKAKKTLNGKELTAGMFQFRLSGEGKDVTVANEADGSIVFPQMSYEKKDVGKHKYTVEEVKGDRGDIEYDTNKYDVVVTVAYDEDEGKLTATADNAAKSLSFINTYKPQEVSISLEATKTLNGAELVDGEFAFVVCDKDGTVYASGKNDAAGKVKFGDITFDKEGTYNLIIKEVNTGVENFTYDETEYAATVKVTDKDGKLEADVSISGGSAEFINTYVPTEDPEDPESPEKGVKTGDAASLLGWLMMTIASEAGLVYAVRKRREDKAA
jgi:pilin isopeptide linkage protein